MAAYPTDVAGASEEPREMDTELTLRHVLHAVRRRWWVVAAVLIVVTALGTWRTVHQTNLYRSAARVQVAQPQSPIQGMQMQQPFDFRVDRLAAEMQVIRSGPVAEGTARDVGLQLVVAEPSDLRRSSLTVTPPRIDSTAARVSTA